MDELFGEETPVERSAELVLGNMRGGPVPAGIARFFAFAGSEERTRAVAAEVARLEPESATALTLAADVASNLDGDLDLASSLLDRAIGRVDGAPARARLAGHLLELGRVADALRIADDRLLDHPDDEHAEEIRADALSMAHRRVVAPSEDEDLPADGSCPCRSGRAWADCCRAAEVQALARFGDRDRLNTLRSAMVGFVAARPDVAEVVDEQVARWLEDVGTVDDGGLVGLVARMAGEHAWIVGGGDEEDDAAGGDLDCPLALFAADGATSPEDAVAADRWLDHCEYGLWQVADPTPGPGVWLTEIVTRVRRYAAVPPEQLGDVGRWTVLLGALVAIDGTWRTTSAVVPLRPDEGDEAAEIVEEMTHAVVSAMSGRTVKRRVPAPGPPEPFGVLAGETEPASPEVADLVGKVVGSGVPQLVNLVHEIRDAAPRLVNTDGDTLCLVKATVHVTDAAAVAERLARHQDIELDGQALTWWGRELDEMERTTSLAEVRAQLRAEGKTTDIVEPDGPRRWLRGRIERSGAGLVVDVNSRERFDRFLGLLGELGEDPVVSDKLVIDPAQDLPQIRSGSMIPFAMSEDAQAAWVTHWPDQRLPALGGQTPRRAAHRNADQPRLEALLRELEHDADLLARRRLPTPDIDRLRIELDMPADAVH